MMSDISNQTFSEEEDELEEQDLIEIDQDQYNKLTPGQKKLVDRGRDLLKIYFEGIAEKVSRIQLEDFDKTYEGKADESIPIPKLKYVQEPNPPKWFMEKVVPSINMIIQNYIYEQFDENGQIKIRKIGAKAGTYDKIFNTTDSSEELYNKILIKGRNDKFKVDGRLNKKTQELLFYFARYLRFISDRKTYIESQSEKKKSKDPLKQPFYFKTNDEGFTYSMIPGHKAALEKRIKVGTDDPVTIFMDSPSLYLAIWAVIIKDAIERNDGMIYPRGLYYWLRGLNVEIPTLAGGLKNNFKQCQQRTWHRNLFFTTFDTEERVKKTRTTEPFDIEERYDTIINILRDLRYYGFIGDEEVGDRRNADVIRFDQAEFYEKAKKPELRIDISITHDPLVELKIPPTILTTEKGQIQPLLQKLADKYVLGYFVSTGQFSIRAVYDFYQWVKAHGNQAIVFTLNDYDKGGVSISQSFARKLQKYGLEDSDPASIIVIPLIYQDKDIKAMQKAGIEFIRKKDERSDRTYNTYQIDQIYQLCSIIGSSVEDYIIRRIRDYIHKDFIVNRRELLKANENQYSALIAELNEQLGLDVDAELSKYKKALEDKEVIQDIRRTLDELSPKYFYQNVKDINFDNFLKQEERRLDNEKQKHIVSAKDADIPIDKEYLKILEDAKESLYKDKENVIPYIDPNAPLILQSNAPFFINAALINRQSSLFEDSQKEVKKKGKK